MAGVVIGGVGLWRLTDLGRENAKIIRATLGTEPAVHLAGPFMAVGITVGTELRVERTTVLFEGPFAPAGATNYDVTADGRRFLLTKDISQGSTAPPTEVHLVLNWFEELERRVPVD